MIPRYAISILATLMVCVFTHAPSSARPGWLEVGAHQRSRYESLDGQFRAGRGGSDEIFAFRTALMATIDVGALAMAAEVVDSRQALADDGTPINTTVVNAIELLQAYAAVDIDDWVRRGSRTRLLVGRHTMDLGSRRLVARNRFRNTINGFTGVNGVWTGPSGMTVRVFFVLPVVRRPSDRSSLIDNDVRIDDESFDVRFWGLHARLPDTFANTDAELGLFGLHEDDGAERPTRDRNLITVDVRARRKAARGAVDFEVESALQLGRSRASSDAADTVDLDHAAHFQRVETGYTFHAATSPRLSLQFDYASGDKDRADGDNNRFDTLFGARRFDFGPTGVYGAFARANIVSPGYRVEAEPRPRVKVMVAHRFYWLASDTDAWTTSGLRDVDGNSGSYVGNQVEARVRWEPMEGTLAVEAGAARLFAGEFIENAPNGGGEGDAAYGYVQTIVTL